MFGLQVCLQKCAIVLGSCSFRESRGKSREKSREKSGSTVRPAERSGSPTAVGEFVFLLSARES